MQHGKRILQKLPPSGRWMAIRPGYPWDLRIAEMVPVRSYRFRDTAGNNRPEQKRLPEHGYHYPAPEPGIHVWRNGMVPETGDHTRKFPRQASQFLERTKTSKIWIESIFVRKSQLLQSPQIFDVTGSNRQNQHFWHKSYSTYWGSENRHRTGYWQSTQSGRSRCWTLDRKISQRSNKMVASEKNQCTV